MLGYGTTDGGVDLFVAVWELLCLTGFSIFFPLQLIQTRRENTDEPRKQMVREEVQASLKKPKSPGFPYPISRPPPPLPPLFSHLSSFSHFPGGVLGLVSVCSSSGTWLGGLDSFGCWWRAASRPPPSSARAAARSIHNVTQAKAFCPQQIEVGIDGMYEALRYGKGSIF